MHLFCTRMLKRSKNFPSFPLSSFWDTFLSLRAKFLFNNSGAIQILISKLFFYKTIHYLDYQ